MYICELPRAPSRVARSKLDGIVRGDRAWSRVYPAACAIEMGHGMSDDTQRQRAGIRGWAWALVLVVLAVYLGFITLAVIRLPGAVGN